jgi:hypothetical protein
VRDQADGAVRDARCEELGADDRRHAAVDEDRLPVD